MRAPLDRGPFSAKIGDLATRCRLGCRVGRGTASWFARKARKHPLLVFLNGGSGGTAGNPSVARALAEEKDFVCVSLPLFKKKLDPPAPANGTSRIILRDADCRYAWPLYKAMLAKLEELVPNIDPAQRVLGGFSNGAHATAGLINETHGEAAGRFSAFFLIDGGGGLRRFDLLKGKPVLMVCGRWRPKQEPALAAGVRLVVYRMKKAEHAFPESEYAPVREWLRNPDSAAIVRASAEESGGLKPGDKAPAFTLMATDGKEYSPEIKPGSTFTIKFPDMPPTFADMLNHNGVKPQMTVLLPTNYDPSRKHPLLIFLNGGDGGSAGNPSVARALSEGKDFVCVSFPLFKEKADPPAPGNGTSRILMRNPDCRFAWPLYKKMLAKLDELVPNIDPGHQILGGFSNGAHTTSGLIDESDGEVARRFSAFFFVEGGGKLERYDLLKGKPFLMVHGSEKSQRRAQEIFDAAKAAGAEAALHGMNNVGHAFPESEFPAVRAWLRGPAME